MCDRIPCPDSMFDVVMSGHVVGDDCDAEPAELARVTKPGGWNLDCHRGGGPSDGAGRILREHGWEEFYYTSRTRGDVYRYRKRIIK